MYKKYVSIPTAGFAFPKKSNQKMNKNLKEIAELVGLTREVQVVGFLSGAFLVQFFWKEKALNA